MNDILLYFAYKYKNNPREINKALAYAEEVDFSQVQRIKDELVKNKIGYISMLDYDYPQQLKEYLNSPHIIFYKGNRDLLKNQMISLAGDFYDDKTEKTLNNSLDTIMKRFTLLNLNFRNLDQILLERFRSQNKPVIHVLTCGHIFYDHYANLENELYISTYLPNLHTKKEYFKQRNELVSQLSKLLLIYNSKQESGIINLAYNFANNNKEVFCYPSNDYNDGNNYLIKNGANLITHIADINYY
ncbi:DNA-processing protein DprA [Mycoplasmopsis opalescens]|uniref:DNA-processing protein DprA n=1 Tax=Mycoplasmopsis opalescens TaxID=114886 RepID=UPI0004A70FD1|nr:DNA-processing protein DprA [Mycoplasmopsis opalescens]